MRSLNLLGAVAVVALWGNPVAAGLYNPAEPWEKMLNPRPGEATNPPSLEFAEFSDKLLALRSIGMENLADNPLRMRYAMIADLSPRLAPSSWPAARKISLGGYLIRRGKHSEADEFLRPLSIREPKNFLALANLATANQLARHERALDYFEQAISAWPPAWTDVGKEMNTSLEQIGWNEETFLWYREAETYHLKLVKQRLRQALGRGKGAGDPDTLDNLFGVDFKYEGDKLADKEKAKLPANALAVVQQLLIWLPDDPRLYWLLGELYHARGTPEDVNTARRILNELGGFNGRFPVGGVRKRLHALGPAPPLPPNMPAPDKDPVAAPLPDDANAIFDLRPLLVGFGAGVLVSFLAYWQIREFRRRRRHNVPPAGS
jgi:tetratricopeptide (TPR) repeat protein